MMKYDTCLNARQILSENGWKNICILSPKKAVRCIMGEKIKYIQRKDGADHATG